MERSGHVIHWIEKGEAEPAAELVEFFLSGQPLPNPVIRISEVKDVLFLISPQAFAAYAETCILVPEMRSQSVIILYFNLYPFFGRLSIPHSKSTAFVSTEIKTVS
jgi:hypothetical protein